MGIQLRNYPECVPFPPTSSRKGFQKWKGKGKGKEQADGSKKGLTMQSLSLDRLYYLYLALKSPDRPLHFALYQGPASGKINHVYMGPHI